MHSLETLAEAFAKALERAAVKLGSKRVHELRLSIWRLLSALELADAVGCTVSRRSRKRLERLLHRLSPLRDVHVQRRALQRSPSLQGANTSRIAATLCRRQRTLARRARRRMKRFRVDAFEHEMRVALALLESSSIDAATRPIVEAALHGRLARLHLGVEAQRQRLPLELNRAGALHRFRLALKNYRYSLEVAAPTLPAKARELAQTAARLQEALGGARDAQLLAVLVRAQLEGRRARGPLEELCGNLERDSEAALRAATSAVLNAQLAWPLDGGS